MKYQLTYILLILLSTSLFAQDTIERRVVKKYIPLEMYKQVTGEKDLPSNYIVRGKDTMVSVAPDFDPFQDQNIQKVAYEPKDEEFLRIYKDVVYNAGRGNSDKERMRYWKEDINIYFDESVPAEHADQLMKFAEKISTDVDSLSIQQVDKKENSNYLVYYLNREHTTDFDPRMADPRSSYYISWNRKQQIYDGSLKVNTELVESEENQLDLLKFNFFRSLGHFKSSYKLDCESFLSACKKSRSITDEDLEILKYHYSYGVCKGADLESFTELTTRLNKKLEEEPNAKLYVIQEM